MEAVVDGKAQGPTSANMAVVDGQVQGSVACLADPADGPVLGGVDMVALLDAYNEGGCDLEMNEEDGLMGEGCIDPNDVLGSSEFIDSSLGGFEFWFMARSPIRCLNAAFSISCICSCSVGPFLLRSTWGVRGLGFFGGVTAAASL